MVKKIFKNTLRKIFFPKYKSKAETTSSNVVHINMQCNKCSKILNTHNGIISAKRNDGSYYVKCSCNYINRVCSNESYPTSTKEAELAQLLFKKNGYNLAPYSYKRGEKNFF